MPVTCTQHTCNSRGTLSFSIFDPRTKRSLRYVQPWLCKPIRVASAGADDILGAIHKASSGALTCGMSSQQAMRTLQHVDSSVIHMCPDKASSNLVAMRRVRRTIRRRRKLPWHKKKCDVESRAKRTGFNDLSAETRYAKILKATTALQSVFFGATPRRAVVRDMLC